MFSKAMADLSLRMPRKWILMPGLALVCSCNEVSISGKNAEVDEELILVETFVQTPLPKVDILWVIDNSPSMASEHEALQEALEPFIEELQSAEVAWQLGVVRTDMDDEDLGLLFGEPWVMSPSLEDPLQALQSALDVGTTGRGESGGVAAASLALSEPLRSEGNRGFRRDDAALHVIIFSDSDDQSRDYLGGDPVSMFLELLEEEAEISGQSSRVSAIVGDPKVGCLGLGGAALPGESYLELAASTGGTTGSICETDFTDLLSQMGLDSITWPVRFELQADPVDGSARVSVDARRMDTGWWLEHSPPAVVFVDPPEAGVTIEIRYEVAE